MSLNPKLAEIIRCPQTGGSISFDDEQIERFIEAMVVPTCGKLFHGVGFKDDYPIAPMPQDLPPGRVLDIGCNWGRWSIGGALQGYDVIGVDPHLQALLCAQALARRLVPENQPLFVACDARHMPFASALAPRFLTVFSSTSAVRTCSRCWTRPVAF